jgi:spore maturation protein CgeB
MVRTERNLILVSRNQLHPALQRELIARGLDIREADRWTELEMSARRRLLGGATWFYGCLRYPVFAWRLRRFLHRYQAPLFAWNQDAPHYLNRASWRLDLLDRVRLLDIYATHTLIDRKRQFADSTLYLPNAADTQCYTLNGKSLADLRNPEGFTLDVSFFGAMDGNRHKEMRGRQEFFSALAEKLAGTGIRVHFGEAVGMTTDELVRRIQQSRISLNFGASCEYGAPVASGLPERCYGIPAVGGFLLCDKRTHASDDFSPGENWVEFDGLDDCVAKIQYWLSNWDAARDLAERCHAHVMAAHTYAHRAEKLHRALLAWHDGQRGFLG